MKTSSGLRERKREGRGADDPVRRGLPWRPGLLLVAVLGLPLAACGGDGPMPPPPPPPPNGPPPPGASLAMELGELAALTTPDAVRSFKLEAASGPREYVVAVHSAALPPPQSFNLQLLARGPDAPGVSGSVVPEPGASRGLVPGELPPELARIVAGDRAHMRLRENMLRELRRVSPRPARRTATGARGGEGPAARFSVAAAAVPRVGDTLEFNFAVQPDFTVSCTNATNITTVVRAVGDRFVLAGDTAVKEGFEQPDWDWDDLNLLLDDVTFPVDSAYFGPPADIDGNDRAVVLFTAQVNKLTPEGSQTFIGGLFWPGDLLESAPLTQGGCPTSNEAEIVYLQAPDPDGDFSDPVPVDRARRNARSVTAHEFQHLLTAEQRDYHLTGDASVLEDVWLSEGFAHIAEEVVGLKVAGLRTRGNLGIQEAAFGTEQAFNAFNIHQLSNFFRLGFHLENPHLTQAFGDPGGEDPGQEQSLQMRGNAWIFLRWLADQYAPAGPEGIVGGSAEEVLFRALSTGGPNHLTGVDNVLRAVREVSGESSITWGRLLEEFEGSLAVDDDGPESLPAVTQVLTWDLRDIFLGLFENTGTGGNRPFTAAYPLQPSVVAMGATTNETIGFTLNPFTSRYFRLTSSGQSAPDLFVEVTNAVGTDPPSSAVLQVTVIRVQ